MERSIDSIVIIGTRGYPSYYGGFETAVRKLAPFLADRGWRVTVYGRPGATVSVDEADQRVHRIETRGIERKSLSTLTFGLTAVLHAMRSRPAVALIMNVANGYWLPLLRLRGIPTVVNVDGMEWERSKWGTVAKLVFKTGARLTARFADEIVVDSEEIGKRWLTNFKRDGAFIPYGGDLDQTSPLPESMEHRGYVLYVARLVPENSVEVFLRAAAELAKSRDVVIVGTAGYGGALETALQSLAESMPRIKWLGHVSDDDLLSSLWRHAGAYFHGHTVGGTNPALVQAMASGSPIIAIDTPYNREVLGPEGVFVSSDANELVEAIEGLFADTNETERIAASARARAQEMYTWQSVCEAYESVLASTLRRTPKR